MDKWELVKAKNGDEYFGEILRGDFSHSAGIYRWNEKEYYFGWFNKYQFSGLCMRTDGGRDFLGWCPEGMGPRSGVHLYDDHILIRAGILADGTERFVALFPKVGAVRFYEARNGLPHGRVITYIPSRQAAYIERFANGSCVTTSNTVVPFKAKRDFVFTYERLGPMDPWRAFKQDKTFLTGESHIKGERIDSSENTYNKRGFLYIQWDEQLNYSVELGQAKNGEFDGWGVSLTEYKNTIVKYVKDTPNKILYAGLLVSFLDQSGDVTIQYRDEVHGVYSDFIRYFSKSDCFVLGSLEKVISGGFVGKCLRVFNFEKVQVSNFANGSFVSNDLNVLVNV